VIINFLVLVLFCPLSGRMLGCIGILCHYWFFISCSWGKRVAEACRRGRRNQRLMILSGWEVHYILARPPGIQDYRWVVWEPILLIDHFFFIIADYMAPVNGVSALVSYVTESWWDFGSHYSQEGQWK
jgi:hypothetical protein